MDPQDSADKLNRYIQSQQPSYDLLTGATLDQRTAFEEVIKNSLGKVALPSTLLVDGDGTVVKTWSGVPSVSEVAQIIDQD